MGAVVRSTSPILIGSPATATPVEVTQGYQNQHDDQSEDQPASAAHTPPHLPAMDFHKTARPTGGSRSSHVNESTRPSAHRATSMITCHWRAISGGQTPVNSRHHRTAGRAGKTPCNSTHVLFPSCGPFVDHTTCAITHGRSGTAHHAIPRDGLQERQVPRPWVKGSWVQSRRPDQPQNAQASGPSGTWLAPADLPGPNNLDMSANKRRNRNRSTITTQVIGGRT